MIQDILEIAEIARELLSEKRYWVQKETDV